jgi:hypothetical protein
MTKYKPKPHPVVEKPKHKPKPKPLPVATVSEPKPAPAIEPVKSAPAVKATEPSKMPATALLGLLRAVHGHLEATGQRDLPIAANVKTAVEKLTKG